MNCLNNTRIERKSRDSAIELYRILLMLGIIILHATYVSKGAGPFHWLNTGMAWCVDGFVFITGYFGCRFSWRKIAKLYGTAIWCGLVIVGLWFVIAKYACLSSDVMEEIGICDSAKWSVSDFCGAVIYHINESWFLHAYTLMMCLVPIVNLAIEKCSKKEFVILSMPFLIAVFGWGIATELPILHNYVPKSSGLGSMTALTLLGCYICGRLYNMYEDRLNYSFWVLSFVLIALLLIDTVGYGWLGRYASPFAVVTAAIIFSFIKRIRLSPLQSKCVLCLSHSMFAIYMLHGYTPCLNLMRYSVGILQVSVPMEITLILISMMMFLICMGLDSIRRVCVFTVRWWCHEGPLDLRIA